MPRPKRSVSSSDSPRRVTLQDIANEAGLNIMTVSNALLGSSIERELNYIPYLAARALSTGRTGFVATMSGQLAEPRRSSLVY